MTDNKMTEDERKFFEFVCYFDHYESETALLFHLQSFLVEKLSVNPLVVFEGGNIPERPDNQWRLSWKRKINGREGDYATYRDIVKKFHNTRIVTYNDSFFYIFTLEKHASQGKYLVFSSDRSLEGSVTSHLSHFLETSYKNVLKFKVIGGLSDLVYHDDVTGLYNQRKLHKDLDEAIREFQHYNVHFYVLFLDIDHFKSINDRHGHLTGTKILLHMADLLKETLRESDLIYRYGGDEFVIIIPNISLETAMGIGRRILNTVRGRHFNAWSGVGGEGIFKLSVSIGVACLPHDAKTKDDILDMADKMMYKAKDKGRGQVCYARELLLRD